MAGLAIMAASRITRMLKPKSKRTVIDDGIKDLSNSEYEKLYLCSNVEVGDISITDYEDAGDITYYTIAITWGDDVHRISKRYNEFLELQERFYGNDKHAYCTLDLPGKDYTFEEARSKKEFLDARKAKLEAWLKERVEKMMSAAAAEKIRDNSHQAQFARRVRGLLYNFLEIKGKAK